MSQKTIVAVTGSEPPYIYDLPHLLSLPCGFEARFRYLVDWVDSDLRGRINQAREGSFSGHRLALVYHSRDSSCLLPIRSAEVLELRRYGPMYFLRFRVGDFPPLSPKLLGSKEVRAQARASEVRRLNNHGMALVGIAGADLSERLAPGCYLREADEGWNLLKADAPVEIDRAQDRQWAALASLLLPEPSLREIPMFFLDGLVDRKGDTQKPVEMENHFSKGDESGKGYRLVQYVRYRLRLVQWRCGADEDATDGAPLVPSSGEHDEGSSTAGGVTDGELGPCNGQVRVDSRLSGLSGYRVKCDVNRETLTVEGQSDLVVGKYDVLEYSLRASGRGYGELSLSVENPTEGGAIHAWPRVYEVRIPISVRSNRLRILIAASLLVVGIAFYILSYVVPTPPTGPDWLPDVGTATLQLVGLGLIYVASAQFLTGYVRFASQTKRLAPTPDSEGG